MSNYYLGPDGNIYSEEELYHYGVPGMKWGVRKSEYKSMTRQQRKKLKNDYYKTEEGKNALKRIGRNATIGTLLGGPLGGVIAGFLTEKRVSESVPSSSSKSVESGKTFISKNADKKISDIADKVTPRTESKRVASVKSRVTGKKENGKPAFLMTEEELDDFTNKYETRRRSVVNQYKKATDPATKQKLETKMQEMENDYLSVVEQDFWYSDD